MNFNALKISSVLFSKRTSLTVRKYSILKSSIAFNAPKFTDGTSLPTCCYSTRDTPGSVELNVKSYEFHQVKNYINSPCPSQILIDVREPDELYESGTIPGSLNIPLVSVPDAFYVDSEEFEERFGFSRPPKDMELIFFCRSGARSNTAAKLAIGAGWSSVGNYKGSWLDWEKQGGMKQVVMPNPNRVFRRKKFG